MSWAAGAIFLCNNDTEEECIYNSLFATTAKQKQVYKKVNVFTRCFLYNTSSKRLLGVWDACGASLEIPVPEAFGGKFPIQFQVHESPFMKSIEANNLDELPREGHQLKKILSQQEVNQVLQLFKDAPGMVIGKNQQYKLMEGRGGGAGQQKQSYSKVRFQGNDKIAAEIVSNFLIENGQSASAVEIKIFIDKNFRDVPKKFIQKIIQASDGILKFDQRNQIIYLSDEQEVEDDDERSNQLCNNISSINNNNNDQNQLFYNLSSINNNNNNNNEQNQLLCNLSSITNNNNNNNVQNFSQNLCGLEIPGLDTDMQKKGHPYFLLSQQQNNNNINNNMFYSEPMQQQIIAKFGSSSMIYPSKNSSQNGVFTSVNLYSMGQQQQQKSFANFPSMKLTNSNEINIHNFNQNTVSQNIKNIKQVQQINLQQNNSNFQMLPFRPVIDVPLLLDPRKVQYDNTTNTIIGGNQNNINNNILLNNLNNNTGGISGNFSKQEVIVRKFQQDSQEDAMNISQIQVLDQDSAVKDEFSNSDNSLSIGVDQYGSDMKISEADDDQAQGQEGEINTAAENRMSEIQAQQLSQQFLQDMDAEENKVTDKRKFQDVTDETAVITDTMNKRIKLDDEQNKETVQVNLQSLQNQQISLQFLQNQQIFQNQQNLQLQRGEPIVVGSSQQLLNQQVLGQNNTGTIISENTNDDLDGQKNVGNTNNTLNIDQQLVDSSIQNVEQIVPQEHTGTLLEESTEQKLQNFQTDTTNILSEIPCSIQQPSLLQQNEVNPGSAELVPNPQYVENVNNVENINNAENTNNIQITQFHNLNQQQNDLQNNCDEAEKMVIGDNNNNTTINYVQNQSEQVINSNNDPRLIKVLSDDTEKLDEMNQQQKDVQETDVVFDDSGGQNLGDLDSKQTLDNLGIST